MERFSVARVPTSWRFPPIPSIATAASLQPRLFPSPCIDESPEMRSPYRPSSPFPFVPKGDMRRPLLLLRALHRVPAELIAHRGQELVPEGRFLAGPEAVLEGHRDDGEGG